MKIYAREAFLIPLKRVTEDQRELAKELSTFRFYNDSACEKCPYFEERPCETCESCPNNLGSVNLSKTVSIKDKSYLSLPIGDRKILSKIFYDEDVKIVDKFKDVPMRRKFEFTGKLLPYQGPAIRDMIAGERGVLKSAPRTGKTVMSSAIVAKLGQKTIIIAAQSDWLENFYETFVGSKTQACLTSINPKRIGFCRKQAEFEKYDVCLATYQTFISPKGKKLLEKIRRLFGVLIIDEVHKGAATEHARVIARFTCKYKFGLSGTPDRKDNKYVVVKKLVGPILHKTEVPRLVPRIEFTPTGLMTARDYKNWTYMIRFIESDPKRLKLIAQWALKDVAKGHLVLIPFTRVAVIRALTKAINMLAGDDIPIAAEFGGWMKQADKNKVIDRARRYKVKVIVGNIKMISTGLNIPRASAWYVVTPSSNIPNAEQRFSRILTIDPKKPSPIIRVFADEMKVCKSCFRHEFWNVIYKLFRPSMTDEVRHQLNDWMNSSKPRQQLSSMKVGRML